MRRVLLSLFVLLTLTGSALAALHFPELTGRVVDDAGILSSDTKQALDQQLAGYEQRTTNQIVVVTVKSLEDTSIEDYGVQLGRTWGIGQKDKNNGALLIVAPKEHKVRIEVGYGLEGILTDAICSEIIRQIILPDFRNGKMEAGVVSGTHAILVALESTNPSDALRQITSDPQSGEYQSGDNEDNHPTNRNTVHNVVGIGYLIFFYIVFLLRVRRRSLGGGYYSFGGGSGFSGGSSGGFSGGGGSFGGGGASGGW